MRLTKSVKYLGVTLDSKLTFTQHIRAASTFTGKAAQAIGRLMPNVVCPSVGKRRLLASVVANKLLYAVAVWVSSGLKFRVNCEAPGSGSEARCCADNTLLLYGVDGSGSLLCQDSCW